MVMCKCLIVEKRDLEIAVCGRPMLVLESTALKWVARRRCEPAVDLLLCLRTLLHHVPLDAACPALICSARFFMSRVYEVLIPVTFEGCGFYHSSVCDLRK